MQQNVYKTAEPRQTLHNKNYNIQIVYYVAIFIPSEKMITKRTTRPKGGMHPKGVFHSYRIIENSLRIHIGLYG